MTTVFDITNARNADDSIKLLVFGYSRSVNNMMKICNNIPDLVCFIIILHCMNEEYFDKPGQNIEISDDKSSIRRVSRHGYDNTTYCKQWISSISNMIVTWNFKVERYTGTILLGIVANNDNHQNDEFTNHARHNAQVYALSDNGGWESILSDKEL